MAQATRERFGFLTAAEVAEIASDPETRLAWLLVRCGCGRFLAPAQDVAHFIEIIRRHAELEEEPWRGSDYVRDVSVPAGGAKSFDPLQAVGL
jgi:hypothetical protein